MSDSEITPQECRAIVSSVLGDPVVCDPRCFVCTCDEPVVPTEDQKALIHAAHILVAHEKKTVKKTTKLNVYCRGVHIQYPKRAQYVRDALVARGYDARVEEVWYESGEGGGSGYDSDDGHRKFEVFVYFADPVPRWVPNGI
jgi:hypothetical protein